VFRGKDVEEIQELKREGLSIRAISRLTGYSRKTIARYLLQPAGRPVYGPRPAAVSKLEPFKPYVKERLQAGVWNAQVLLHELRERSYSGSYTILTDWLRPQRKEAVSVAVRRFETPPGKQAQVDWGHLGSLSEHGVDRALWGFTITLGYSRRMMAEAATDQKLGTLLRMHEAAFNELGAVPEEILYDRMRTIWAGTDERGEIIWNAVFLDFARYWGFTPRLCRPYRAQTKGKVESGVKYVRRNFLCGLQGREPANLADLNAELLRWIAEVANQRVHGTTHEQVVKGGEKVSHHGGVKGDHRGGAKRRRGRRAKPARRAVLFFGRERNRGGGKVGNLLLVFHFSIRRRRRSCGNVGISPVFGEISKGLVGRVGSLPLAFHAFHSPGISTALFLLA